jgi:hypothetical protein
MIERRAIASKADNTRPADAPPKSGNGAQPSLESRIAAALRADASPSVADLGALIGEAEVAAAAAATTAIEERERALDISTDPATAHERVLIAELSRDRLRVALPRLEHKLGEAQRREDGERWDAHYRRLAVKVEEAAVRVAEYPALAAEIVELVNLATAVDKEVSELHMRAAAGEPRRLPQVELLARGLRVFSRRSRRRCRRPRPRRRRRRPRRRQRK